MYGDFNEVLYAFEKVGGLSRAKRKMEDFRDTLKDCNMMDMGYSGCWFT